MRVTAPTVGTSAPESAVGSVRPTLRMWWARLWSPTQAHLVWQGSSFPIPDHLTEEERARVEQERTTWRAERGYLDLQGHRPETIAAALTDSPVGQLAWIVEKFQTWTNPASKTPDEAVDRDQLLSNVSLYWFTRSGASCGPLPVRGCPLESRLGGAVRRTERLGGVQHRADHAAVHGSAAPDGLLGRAQRRRPLRSHGRARVAG